MQGTRPLRFLLPRCCRGGRRLGFNPLFCTILTMWTVNGFQQSMILNPGTSGVWARDAKLHGGPTLRGAYKGQIIDWKFSLGNVGREVTNNPRVESILIRWAYAPRQTRLDPDVVVQRPKCNCKYFHFMQLHSYVSTCVN